MKPKHASRATARRGRTNLPASLTRSTRSASRPQPAQTGAGRSASPVASRPTPKPTSTASRTGSKKGTVTETKPKVFVSQRRRGRSQSRCPPRADSLVPRKRRRRSPSRSTPSSSWSDGSDMEVYIPPVSEELRRLIPEHDHKLFTWTDEPLDPPSSNTRSWTREMELGGGCCYCPDGTDE